jgi:organic hydroperoxide reductase OsmC/OhrA
MEAQRFRVTVSRRQGFSFSAGFDNDGWPAVLVDEPRPVGGGAAPNPTRMMGVAVGSCLSASLLFCLGKARVDVDGFESTVEGTVSRNADGRLRITELRVTLAPSVHNADRQRMQGCLSLFEEFCTVTASVRRGIPIHVEVTPTSSD